MRFKFLRVFGVGLLVLLAPSSATASQTTVFPDGFYAISTGSATIGARAATGSGGVIAWTGTRSYWVRTSVYNIFGTRVFTFKSGVYWEWENRTVTKCSRYSPSVSKGSLPWAITMTYQNGPAWWFLWKGHVHGGRYLSVTGHIEASIFRYGVVGRWNVQHAYKVYGNGYCWWESTI